jgi:hypothetical protein
MVRKRAAPFFRSASHYGYAGRDDVLIGAAPSLFLSKEQAGVREHIQRARRAAASEDRKVECAKLNFALNRHMHLVLVHVVGRQAVPEDRQLNVSPGQRIHAGGR